MLFFISTIILTRSSLITSSDTVHPKVRKNLGRVGYYFEYLGEVPRAPKPPVKSENIIPPERLPKFNVNPQYTEDEKRLVLQETTMITTNFTKTHSGSYDAFDKDGNLYLKGERLKYANGTYRKLYKHQASIGQYFGDVSDSEPAIKKKLTYRPRYTVFSVTGLFAPPGELITVEISKQDLQRIRKLELSIGPILNNGKANNIWFERNDFVRMPVIANYFILDASLQPSYYDGTNYKFYVGSFLGGPIYVKNTDDSNYDYTITISGAVKYPHYILGYTTPEELEDNKKSSAPYFDVEVWQNGILHSGPKSYLAKSDIDSLYDASIYWQKVTSVSRQVPSAWPATVSVNMMYEPFIAAGAAVAFVSQGSTNCPLTWFTYTTDYKGCLQDSSCDTWGPHHEYHHHFQSDYGLTVDVGETSNNLVTLISYSYFSAVSQRRTEDREPDGDGWNTYTSASWTVNDCINTIHTYHLNFFALFLHCFGQELTIEALNKEKGKSNEKWYSTWADLTGLDFAYFFRHVYNSTEITISDTIVDKYKHLPNFVPIACRYQTGIGYKINGQYNTNMRTMYPFFIRYGEDKVLNFTKQMVVPKGFTYTIKSVTNPEHGTLTKQQENIYLYRPDPNNILSGVMTFTIGLTKSDDSNFKVDDIQIYVELQQTKTLVDKYNNGQDMLDRTIYTYPTDVIPENPIDEYTNNFGRSISHITILNNETEGGDNTQIMTLPGANVNNQNRVSVLEGKFEVDAGKYRIALQCRNRGALYLSYDGGKTYELGCQILFESLDERYYTDHPEIFATHEFASPQWVYFKFVVCHKMEHTGRRMFSKIGLDKYKDDGQISSSVTDLNKARNLQYEANPTFYAKDVYPKVWRESRVAEFFTKGKLIETNYEKYPDPNFDIESMFDDDDSNIIHTNGGFLDRNPLYLFVDLEEEVTANTMTFYGAFQGHWQYLPTNFVLYGGTNKDNLEKITEVTDAEKINGNVQVSFEQKQIRYYKLNITKGTNGFAAFRFIRFSNQYRGTLVSLDDDRVTLYNGWKKINSPISTFGNSYEAESSNSKVSFQFEGTGFVINAAKSSRYGTFQVHVDNVKKSDVNLNGQPVNTNPKVYQIEGLSNAKHTVTLVGSNGIYNIDSFMILQNDLASVDENLPVNSPPTPTPDPPATPARSPEATIPLPEYIEPTNIPSEPFLTPEPIEIEQVPYSEGIVDSTPFENNEVNQKEYESVVTDDQFLVIGKGHDNLYISIKNNNKNTDILKTDAKFGIKLDSSTKDTSITLNQENPNMNIKGSGTLTIDTNSDIHELNLNNATVSHGETLNIHTNQLDSFELNNLNMYGNSVFNPSTANGQNTAKAKTLIIGEGANAKLSNLQILNKVVIGLNAILTLADAELENADQLQISYSKQPNRVSLAGKIGNPPKSISLVEAESSLENSQKLLLLEKNAFTIVSAKRRYFPECEEWKNKVNIKGTAFSNVECVEINATEVESGVSLQSENDDEIKLVAYYKSNDGSSGGNKSKTGLIVGVVFAVIAVLAIVGVVIFFVLKKKRNAKRSSSDIDFAVTV